MAHRHALALLLAAGVVLAGCSDGAQPAETGPRPMGPPQDPVAAESARGWVDGYCRALAPAVGPSTPPPVVEGDLLGSRERMLTYLDQRVAAIQQAQASIESVGPAPNGAGQSVLDPVSTLLDQRATTLSELAGRLRAVPAVAEPTLFDALRRTRDELVLADRGAVLADLSLPPDLQQVATTVPNCAPLLPAPGAR